MDDPECDGCGYALRGLAADGSCPECGLAVAASRRPRLVWPEDRKTRRRVASGCRALAVSAVMPGVVCGVVLVLWATQLVWWGWVLTVFVLAGQLVWVFGVVASTGVSSGVAAARPGIRARRRWLWVLGLWSAPGAWGLLGALLVGSGMGLAAWPLAGALALPTMMLARGYAVGALAEHLSGVARPYASARARRDLLDGGASLARGYRRVGWAWVIAGASWGSVTLMGGLALQGWMSLLTIGLAVGSVLAAVLALVLSVYSAVAAWLVIGPLWAMASGLARFEGVPVGGGDAGGGRMSG